MAQGQSFDPISQVQLSSTGIADVKTAAPPSGALACIVGCETSVGRVTFDGSTPTTANGHLWPIGVNAVQVPVGDSVKFAGNAAASLCNITWLG